MASFCQKSNNNSIVKIPKTQVVGDYKGQPNVVKNGVKTPTSAQMSGSYEIKPRSQSKKVSNASLNQGKPIVNNLSKQNIVKKNNNNNNNNNNTSAVSNKHLANPKNNPRNLPLNSKGNLISVDGYEVTFDVPNSSKTSNVCSTPMPTMIDGNKNAACGFIVPRDNPASRDVSTFNTVKYFQLRWLVFTDGGPATNIDQTRINALMNELNADYAAYNMVFCADPATFLESSTWYTHNSNTDEFPMKDANNVTPTQVINIYVVGSMTAGGYARMPYDPNGGTDAHGGIVLNKGNCSVGTHTLAHEMGHTFGLFHTFNGVAEQGGPGSCSNCYERVRNTNGSSNASGVPTPLGGPYTSEGDQEGDWCSDTHPHDQDSYQCPGPAGATGGCDLFGRVPANFPVDNHMSYSFCTSTFTDQQSRRMHGMVDDYLGSWVNYGGGICGSLPPVAEFVGTPTNWQSPSTVNFTDLSQPTAIITGWTWDFNSAGQAGTVTPATFVGQTPPPVVYDIGGAGGCLDYEVTLTITGNGGDTEVKTSYINVCPASGDCDTLDLYWTTPASSPTWYNYAGGYLTGVQDPGNQVTPATDIKGMYERYITPNPGVSTVGAIRVGLGNLNDADGDMRFQVAVYDDDGTGAPGALLGGRGGLDPNNIGVPGWGFYNEIWIPLLTPLTPTTGSFHVAVEILPQDATDSMLVISSVAPQGQGNGLNHIFTTGWGMENLLGVYGVDIDLDIVPMMGEWAPLPLITGFTENVVCDTTFVTLFDTILYTDYAGTALTGLSFTFADGTVVTGPPDPGTINRTYTQAGPDTVTIVAINDCGRADTTVWYIPYNFLSTPDAEFTKVQGDPICMGAPGVDFNANTSGYQDYTWDFGDGAVQSSGDTASVNHVYNIPGLYYTSLTVTSTGYQPIDILHFEDFESGWPAGYLRFNNDVFTPNVAVNPPFTGSNATAWLDMDVYGDGNTTASSTSFNTLPTEQADDWMITSGIGPLPANQMLTWDAIAEAAPNFPDGYEVRISTTQLPANVGNYATVLFSTAAENGFTTQRSVSLASYAGQTVYIAFRNNSTDEFILSIDDIWVGTTGPGCTATITKTDFVEIINCTVLPPVADLNATDSTGCAPLTITFTDATVSGDPATSWLWNFGDGNFSTSQNPPTHVYTVPNTYFVSFQACNSGGCTTDYITVLVGTGVTAIAGAAQNICGTTATLAGNDPAPDTGLWSVLAGTGSVTTPTAFNSGVTGLSPGLNQFVWTVTGTGCVSIDTVDITVAATPTTSNAGAAQNVCGTTATLAGNVAASGTGTWTLISGAGTITTPGSATSGITGLGVGANVFEWSIANLPCAASMSQVTITGVATPTTSNAGTAQNVCGTTATLAGNVPAIGTGTWTLISGAGTITTPGSATSGLTGLGVGANVFEWSIANAPCAASTSQVTITGVATPTTSNAGAAQNVCGTTATLAGNVPASGTGTWTLISGTGTITTPGSATSGITGLGVGANVFEWSIANLPCAASTSQVTITGVTPANAGTSNVFGICATALATDLFPLLGGADLGGAWTGGPPPLTGGDQGTFDPSTNIAGVYTYTVTGVTPCANAVSTVTVTITAGDDPTFVYP
ncbi:MAG: hypothetical protein COB15_06190, partial [Flavobacteriales bacterium]